MINKDQLRIITKNLMDEVWRNDNLVYILQEENMDDLIDIISSLHNLLYEAVTGNLYDYAWHWTNKIGSWTNDHYFDELIGRGKND